MAERPSGTVTLLFTDVEGSTRLLGEFGTDRYAEVLDLHRRLLREAFERHDGFEVGTEGDSFFVVFGRAEDAVIAAGEAQRALRDAAWPPAGRMRVRMGLHTGEPSLVGLNYVGMDVHRAARIMAAAHGSQVLVSETTAALLDGVPLRDLGAHRLKDLLAPIRLYQLEVEGVPGEFPPLRSLYRTNLPTAAWPLLGRDRELAEIRTLIADGAQLLTLTGPGGSGKTRLALQAAAELSDDFVDGVFFVALAPLRDLSAVRAAVADAVGVEPDGDLVAWLDAKRALLVLDNLEHLAAVEGMVAELLGGETTFIATSRASLRLSAEREVPVEPLANDAAVELFISRAAAVGRRFAADATVAEVCRRLDNLPLALELAAARAKVLSPAALLQRLDAALTLLTAGAADLPERQRTLRATIEWSHDLLDPHAQVAFRRLSIFRGSFSLDAAEAVTEADLEQVATLLDQNLLKPLGLDRFFMLETLREYASEQLDAANEKEPFGERHARYYASLIEAVEGKDTRVERTSVRAVEAANLQAAIAFAGEHDDAETRLRLLTYVGQRCSGLTLPYYTEALADALEKATVDPVLRSNALYVLAFDEYRAGDYRAAQATAESALDLAEQCGASDVVNWTLSALAAVAATEGDFERARGFLDRGLARSRAAGDREGIVSALVNLGDMALVAGDYEGAIDLTAEAIEHARAHDDLQVPLVNLAAAHIHLGHFAEAEDAASRSLAATPELRDTLADVFALRVFAASAATRNDHERAAFLLGAADALEDDVGARSDPSQSALRDKVLRTLDQSLGLDDTRTALDHGRALTAEQALNLALGQKPAGE